MTSLEFRAGMMHAASLLRAEADGLTMTADGARKLCLSDAADRLNTEAKRRDLRVTLAVSGGDQTDMFGGAA